MLRYMQILIKPKKVLIKWVLSLLQAISAGLMGVLEKVEYQYYSQLGRMSSA